VPGFSEKLIVGSMIIGGLAVLIAGALRLRKKLAASANPNLFTYVNELGGYAIFGVLLLIGGIALLFESDTLPPEAVAAQSISAPNSNWTDYRVADGQFVISVPDHWEKRPAPGQMVADLYVLDRQSDLHLSVRSLSREDFAVSSPAEAAQSVIRQMQSEAEGELTVTPSEDLILTGRPANKTVIGMTVNRVNFTIDLYWIQGDQRWIEFRFLSPRSKYEESKELFTKIASSIRRSPPL